MNHRPLIGACLLLAAGLLTASCNRTTVITSGNLRIEYDSGLNSRVASLDPETGVLQSEFGPSEYLETLDFRTGPFRLTSSESLPVSDKTGTGTETRLTGNWTCGARALEKTVEVRVYDSFPGMAVFRVSFVNTGEDELLVRSWTVNQYALLPGDDSPEFWSFQGSSSEERSDWVLPVTRGFYQENFMGMNQSDYGGGIPVTDLWRKDGGIAVGHVEPFPREISLPVVCDALDGTAEIGITKTYDHPLRLAPGDTLETLETFVSVHRGDYFSTLREYSRLLQARGMEFAPSEDAAFESIWCGWGYERKFTVEDILQTLPKVKELGIKWAVIDDGFQVAEGDWQVDTKRFPGGSADMKRMVDAIHSYGLKAKLWWAPLAADPGSKVLRDHPDALLINKSGSPQYITWWDSYYLSPASDETMSYTLGTVEMFMRDWGFDGLKMDGQHMNAVPADYNWKRHLEYPERSIEMLPEFFKTVFHAAREIKPHAVIEHCPCGTCMSVYNMPYTNQVVSSDPTSSWQIRLKGKTYKAIMPSTAYYGDHVELSDGGDDFASSFGVGAVLGTKFTWPKDNPSQRESQLLTPEKEKIWKHWFSLYDKKMLSRGKYLGTLYDIGYDRPETHVIARGDTLYYAFYADRWEGDLELRGLDSERTYSVTGYVNNQDLGTVRGTSPYLPASFSGSLLIEVVPGQ